MKPVAIATFLRRRRAFPAKLGEFFEIFQLFTLAAVLPVHPCMSPEIRLGRALAVVAHPQLAWRMLSTRGRFWLAGAYVAAGYLTVLTALLLTRP